MKKAFLQLHLSVLLAGWTGIFGKLITMSPGFIVLWRIIIAGTLLWGWLALRRTIEYVRPKDRLGIMAVGALLMIQWTLFYAAIKASNVSITIVTFSSMGFFTAILEPLITRTRMSIKEIGFSILTVFGISLIFHFDTQYRTGIMLSLTSAAGRLFPHVQSKVSRNDGYELAASGRFGLCARAHALVPFHHSAGVFPANPNQLPVLAHLREFLHDWDVHPADSVARKNLRLHRQPHL